MTAHKKFLFGTERVAHRVVQGMFPAGTVLEAADPEAVLSGIRDVISRSVPGRIIIALGLICIDLSALFWRLRPFRLLTPEQASGLLEQWSRVPGVRLVLQGLLTPYKIAYLLDKGRQDELEANVRVQAPAVNEKHRWQSQISDVSDSEDELTIDADVVVVGTGAGGAAAAYELASCGLAVAIVEEGQYWERQDFTGDHLDMVKKLYRAYGITGTVGNTVIPIPLGRGVGGTTTINSGTCYRAPDSVFQDWQDQGIANIDPRTMDSIYDEVADILSVQLAGLDAVGPIADIIGKGAEALGFSQAGPLPRNAEGCDGQALCQFGCPTEAKKSTNVSYIPKALEQNAFLFTGYRVDALNRYNGRVSGVMAVGTGRHKHKKLTINAPNVVIAMGSMLTPLFLKKNGVRNKWLGKNLSIHPACGIAAHFPGTDMRNATSIPQGFGVTDMKSEGLMFEGATPPIVAHGLVSATAGHDFVSEVEGYKNTAYFGFMIKDRSRGRVRRKVRKEIPFVTYKLGKEDFRQILQGFDILARLFFAAGAETVSPIGCTKFPVIRSVEELEKFSRRSWKARDFVISAYHPLGTARIAATPEMGVCTPDHEVHGHPGLYVMDGSSIPSSLGVNPQMTIMALATRAARTLAGKIAAA